MCEAMSLGIGRFHSMGRPGVKYSMSGIGEGELSTAGMFSM